MSSSTTVAPLDDGTSEPAEGNGIVVEDENSRILKSYQLSDLMMKHNGGLCPEQSSLRFSLRVYGDSKEGVIEVSKLRDALQLWDTYRKHEVFINETFKKYGDIGALYLELPQILEMMKGFRGKRKAKVSETAAAYVINEAINRRAKANGLPMVILRKKKIENPDAARIRRDEIHKAMVAWNHYMMKHQSTGSCVVL